MALQLAFTDSWGNTYPAAYVMLRVVITDKIAKQCTLKFGIYPTKAVRESNPGPVMSAIDVVAEGDAFDLLMAAVDESGRSALYEFAKGVDAVLAAGQDV